MQNFFGALSILAIIAGGTLAAFSARKPTTYHVWASAYLVLVVGIIQYGLVTGWAKLSHAESGLAALAFGLYNLGNIGVMYGTATKSRVRLSRILVSGGGAFIAVSMALLAWTVRGHTHASWTFAWFIALVLFVLVTMTIGMDLSGRRRNR